MDALSVLDKLDQVEILFEPIYSADEHRIVAYEVTNCELEGNELLVVEEFIYNEDIPEEIRSEIEQLFVRKALQKVISEGGEIDIYIPCNPNLLMIDHGESYFSLLKEYLQEDQLPRLTLVMNEHLYKGDLNMLHHVIKYIKTFGINIALNNIGVHSQLNAILLLEPSVLKMNVGQLNYNLWGNQNHVFTTLRSLAMKMGASLLVCGIETIYQLQHGWKNGARYYKGAYLQRPTKHFIPRDTLKPRFKNECEQFIATEKKLIRQRFEEEKKLGKVLLAKVQEMSLHDKSKALLDLAQKLDGIAFRLYICDSEGFQVTPNIMKKSGTWNTEQEALHKNWSWRPYFLQNLLKLREENHVELSAAYSDIATEELTRTFSMALPNSEYLFIDIEYNYLYEHNIVM